MVILEETESWKAMNFEKEFNFPMAMPAVPGIEIILDFGLGVTVEYPSVEVSSDGRVGSIVLVCERIKYASRKTLLQVTENLIEAGWTLVAEG